MNKPESLAQKIRSFAKGKKVFGYPQLFSELGCNIFNTKEKKAVRAAMQDMVMRGEMKRVSRGVYARHKEAIARGRPPEKRRKVWKAMRILKKFTKKDVALVVGCSHIYIKKLIYFLIRKGYVEPIAGGRGKTIVYIVKRDEKDFPEGFRKKIEIVETRIEETRQLAAEIHKEIQETNWDPTSIRLIRLKVETLASQLMAQENRKGGGKE